MAGSSDVAKDFAAKLAKYGREENLRPIHQAVANMSKGELASAAAALVNLNSFQKRMSMGPETVGGPVDVAVITKGDGFIWTDRKHYFNKDQNPHFIANYYRERNPNGDDDGPAAAPAKASEK